MAYESIPFVVAVRAADPAVNNICGRDAVDVAILTIPAVTSRA